MKHALLWVGVVCRKATETGAKPGPRFHPAMVEAAREAREERCPADFRVELRDAGGAKVELKGELPHGWCGQLAAALSRRGVSIVRGSASAEGPGWYGLLEVTAGPEVKLDELDYWELVNEPPAEPDGVLRLESFVLTTSRNV